MDKPKAICPFNFSKVGGIITYEAHNTMDSGIRPITITHLEPFGSGELKSIGEDL